MNTPQADMAAPALGLSVQCAAGDCQIVFQTHVAQDTDKPTLDALVERLTAVAARQKAKVDLVEAEKNLAVSERELARMRADRARIESALSADPQEGRRTNRVDTARLEQQRAQADATEKQYGENIRELRGIVDKNKALIAGE